MSYGEVAAGYLTDNELDRLRRAKASVRACEVKPSEVSFEEITQHHAEYSRVVGELIREHQLDESEDWTISVYTGRIYYK